MNDIAEPSLRFTPADLRARLESWASIRWVDRLPTAVITGLTVVSVALAAFYHPALWVYVGVSFLSLVIFTLQAIGLLDFNPEPLGTAGWRELNFSRWRLRLITTALLLVIFAGVWLMAATGEVVYTMMWAVPGFLVLEICVDYMVMRYDPNPDLY